MKEIGAIISLVFVLIGISYLIDSYYPFVWYKTEDLAIQKYVDLYGEFTRKASKLENNKLEVDYYFEKNGTTCHVSLVKNLLGFRISFVSISNKNESTYTAGLYRSHTVYLEN